MIKFSTIDSLAKSMGFGSYQDYLESDHWKNLKRKKGMSECCVCRSKSGLLAHHINYRGLLDVALSDLAVMCKSCHDDFHLCCRNYDLDYIGVQPQRIQEMTEAFRLTPYFIKRAAKIERKRARRAKPDRKKTARLKFRKLIRGPMTDEAIEVFCSWLKTYNRQAKHQDYVDCPF